MECLLVPESPTSTVYFLLKVEFRTKDDRTRRVLDLAPLQLEFTHLTLVF